MATSSKQEKELLEEKERKTSFHSPDTIYHILVTPLKKEFFCCVGIVLWKEVGFNSKLSQFNFAAQAHRFNVNAKKYCNVELTSKFTFKGQILKTCTKKNILRINASVKV